MSSFIRLLIKNCYWLRSYSFGLMGWLIVFCPPFLPGAIATKTVIEDWLGLSWLDLSAVAGPPLVYLVKGRDCRTRRRVFSSKVSAPECTPSIIPSPLSLVMPTPAPHAVLCCTKADCPSYLMRFCSYTIGDNSCETED